AATSRQRVIDPQLEPSAPRRRGWKRMKVAPAQRQQRENESLGAVGGHVGFPGVEPPAPRRSGWKRVEVAPAQKPGKKKGRKPSVATLYCDICNKHFENKRAQQQHNYRRHKERPTPICGQCGKSFATKGSLKEHIQGAHENVGEQQCTFGCGAKFPTMKTRVRHETRRHTIKTNFINLHK
ncbi:zinc finger protein-like protein, partial [Leptotrombidium deliense]